MKRIFSFLFAIITLVGTTSVFTSCQEDAPEINYTINITVNNDFTEVVNAINNGTMKQEAAIAALTAAINQMNGDQTAKMQALIESINTLAATLDAKLAIIEAAMKAQTLALETKLGLIEAAIKALPDYTDQLKAIEAAIKGMPDYSDKLAAIETAIKNIPDYSEKMDAIEAAIKNAPDYTTALEEIKKAIAALPNYTEQLGAIITAIEALPDYSKQLEAISAAVEAIPDYSNKFDAIQTALAAIAKNIKDQQNQYADELEDLTESIDAITKAVEAGDKSQKNALAEIIALLESGAIAGGGSGSGSGGEGEGDESYYVTFKSNAGFTIVVPRSEKNIYKIEGATVTGTTDIDGFSGAKSEFKKNFQGTMITLQPTAAGVVTLKGKITQLISEIGPTEIDATKNKMLEALELYGVETLVKLTVANDGALTYIDLMCCEGLAGANATAFMNSLPTRTAADDATLIVKDRSVSWNPSFSLEDIGIAQGKNWKVIDSLGEEQIGKGETDETYYITFKSKNSEIKIAIPQSEKGIYKIEGATVTNTDDSDGLWTVEGSFMLDYKITELTLKPTTVGGEIKISGKITGFIATNEGLTKVDASHNKALELLYIPRNPDLQKLVIAEGGDLKYLHLYENNHTGLINDAQTIVNSLQNKTGALFFWEYFTTEQYYQLIDKGWKLKNF